MSAYLTTQLRGSPATPLPTLLRRHLGLMLVLAGVIVVASQALPVLATRFDAQRLLPALLGGLLGAAATAAGALPVLFARRVANATQGTLLAAAAGVMLAATCFSLLLPALDSGAALWGSRPLAALAVAVGLLLGAGAVALLGRVFAARPPVGSAAAGADARRSVALFVAAVTLHNVPEGLAVGLASAADAIGGGALAWGIAIQDLPEGLAVALALASIGARPATAFAIGAGSGLVEPLAALAGAAAVGVSSAALPWGLALAAGAMLRVICLELLPQALRDDTRHAGSALIGGFALMLLLDTALA